MGLQVAFSYQLIKSHLSMYLYIRNQCIRAQYIRNHTNPFEMFEEEECRRRFRIQKEIQ